MLPVTRAPVSGAVRSAWATERLRFLSATSRWSTRAVLCPPPCSRCEQRQNCRTESFHASRDLCDASVEKDTSNHASRGQAAFYVARCGHSDLKGRIRARHKAGCPRRPCVPSMGIPRGSNERCIGCPSSYGSSPPVVERRSLAGIASVPTAHDIK